MKERDWDGASIVILDFGSQYTQLIARRIRAAHVFSVILPNDASIEEIRAEKPVGIVLSGGPASVIADGSPGLEADIFSLGLPVLGICYGMQLISRDRGSTIERAEHREYGHTMIEAETSNDLFHGTPASQRVWMSHGDRVKTLPRGFRAIASSEGCPLAAVVDDRGGIYGLQFHPEVFHTEHGDRILGNFLFRICGAEPSWSSASFVEREIEKIREKVGTGRVLCAVSGGVDSSVMAVLVDRAIGAGLCPVFVDNGLLREGEVDEVRELFSHYITGEAVIVDAADEFLSRLDGLTDAEEKRKAIGKCFIDVFEEQSRIHGPFDFLAQGTLYPDVIESCSTVGPSATIKSHHNVGGLPEELGFELVEPLALLFKDEVREVGRFLGLPEKQIGRHPFPGPGLGVRVPGAVCREDLDLLRKVDRIFIDALKREKLYDEVWQAFAVLLPVKSVGVMGDERTYQRAAALRAVTSTDGMTADWARLPYDFLQNVASEIINRVDGVNRVVYDISSKPPSTIEWE
ncbi:MAG: glutamine-hydrolyzing GMP synthase [Candidatus Krumholzibacteriota bacterium]|nr:glutamine-hydrolyzing GMP synthase [Candidatus Krumholzibacteriota bacterium]